MRFMPKTPLSVAAALGAGLLTLGGVAAAVLGGSAGAAAATGSGSSGGATVTAPLPHGGPGPRGPGGPGGPRGPWGPGPGGPRGMHGPGRGIAGTVQSVASGGGSFTVLGWGQKTYTVTTGSSTTYGFGPGLTASAVDVQQGERVMVAGKVSGTDVTATAVHIQAPMERGQVIAVSGTQVTVQQPGGRQAVVDISGVANPPSVSKGQQVAAAGSWTGTDTGGIADTLDAKAFAVVPAHLVGTVGTVSGDSATVATRSGTTVTLQWTATTVITSGPPRRMSASASGASTPASTVTLAAGDHILAIGQRSGTTFDATRIVVMPAPPAPPASSPAAPAS